MKENQPPPIESRPEPKFERSDVFSNASEDQVVKPVEFAKGTLIDIPSANFEEAEKDSNLREQTNKVTADFEASEWQTAREKVRQEQIAKSRMPEAQARRKARLDTFDARTDRLKKEREKAQSPDAIARHKKVLDNFDSRTEDILAEKNRTKLKMWKNLVENYLAGGEEALKAELFDLNRTGKMPTKETLEKDLSLQKQLAAMFAADSKKRTVQDFFVSMPSEEEYVENTIKKINANGRKNKDISIMPSQEVLDELDRVSKNYNTNHVTGKLPNVDIVKELERVRREKDKDEFLADFDNVQAPAEKNQEIILAEQARDVYVKAYRAYDSKATKNKTDDMVAVLKPPFFALRSAARSLKQLYASMIEAQQIVGEILKREQIAENLAASDLVKPKGGISPELIKAAQEINEQDQEKEWLANKQATVNAQVDRLTEKRTFPLPSPQKITEAAAAVRPGFKSDLVENFKRAKTAAEGISDIKEKQVEAIARRLREIEDYFKQKGLPKEKDKMTVRQFLMGAEIKGLFKGEQKRLQSEYQALFNSGVYQKFLAE